MRRKINCWVLTPFTQSRSGNGNPATAFTGVTTNVSGVVTTVIRNNSVATGNVTQVSGVASAASGGVVTVNGKSLRGGMDAVFQWLAAGFGCPGETS